MFRVCLAWLLFASSGAAVAATAVVTLKAQADVPQREIRLADIADIQTDDDEAAGSLRYLPVGRIDVVAGTTRLTRASLARHVERRLPQGVRHVEWRGADAVLASLAAVRLDPALVVERAESALRAQLERDHTNVQLRPASRPDAIRLPAGEHTLQARVPPGATQLARRMRVDVDVRCGGQLAGVLPIWFDVQAQAVRWVSRRDLPAGHVLRPGDVELREVDVAGVAAPALEPTGQRLRRALRAGAVVPASAVEDMPWVSRQEPVTVEVRTGAVVVESRGIALADGRAGEWVAVRVPGSDLLRGRVVGPKRLAM